MDREVYLNEDERALYRNILGLYNTLDSAFNSSLNRSVPFDDVFVDRWERAKKLGFGEKTSVYSSSLIIGDVKVGTNCWIGPFTIIDGSGGLNIGDFCTISAGVHIYSHDNIAQTLTSGVAKIDREEVVIGNNCYLAPNVVINKGVKIGNECIIGANSFIKEDVESNSLVVGQPGRKIGETIIDNGKVKITYL